MSDAAPARPHASPAEKYADLGPSDAAGLFIVLAFSALTAAALALSSSSNTLLWFAGQLLLALAFIQWFVLLHEAGHGTLFRTRAFGLIAGHIASFFCLIPFRPWRAIHGLHHKWTGWQDMDPTTASLVPRPLAPFERALINTSWKLWIPLFSILYRLRNFWHIPRLFLLFTSPARRRPLLLNILLLFTIYAATIYLVGPTALIRLIALALLLSLIFMDPILLSQHTHIPMRLARGAPVSPIPPLDQAPFTRSLRFPPWFSTLILHFDAHEHHHLYPHVSGYHLHQIDEPTPNDCPWLPWILAAKRVPAHIFMFKNRNDTGLPL